MEKKGIMHVPSQPIGTSIFDVKFVMAYKCSDKKENI